MNALIVDSVNLAMKELFYKFPGSRLFGLSETVTRQDGDTEQQFPAIINPNGEGQPIIPDDAYPATVYHKQNSILSSEKPNSGYGNGRALKSYIFSNTMIVHINGPKTNVTADEMVSLIEANLPDTIRQPNIRSVNLSTQSFIMSTLQVYSMEYKNVPYRLPLNYYMMAIGYKAEAIFDKNCIPKC